jgi:predicted DNA-binding antitoxin AbrB/MazE fold protein
VARIHAIFEGGVLKPLEDPELAEHELVEIEIRRKPEGQGRRGQRTFGSAKGLIIMMADDFDEPLEDFCEYS